jgi:hypothetical protein
MTQRAKIGCLGVFGIVVAFCVALGAGVVLWIHLSFPTASYRYRLTIAVESDGQVHSGSSVIEVNYRFYPSWFAGGTFERHLQGQAVLIRLGARGVLAAALEYNIDRSVVGANDLAIRAFDRGGRDYPTLRKSVEAIFLMRGPVDLTQDNMPAFIWFSDDNDPETAHLVKPQNFPAVIGDATRVVSARLEITRDPIIIDIDEELPLYKKLREDTLLLGDSVFLNRGMFIASESVK